MHGHRILSRAVMAVALILALTAGPASANGLSMSDHDIRFTYRELTYIGFEATIECEVTLIGSFASRTFSKVTWTRIGQITSARVATEGCEGGDWVFLPADLPWSILYDSFSGRLPNITGVELWFTDYSFNITTPSGISCLARSTFAEPVGEILNREASGVVTSLSASESYVIDADDVAPSILCDISAGNIIFFGTASVDNGAGGFVTMTLI